MELTTLEMQWVCWVIGVVTGFRIYSRAVLEVEAEVTAPTPEKIERWEWVDVWEGPSIREADDGAFVTYSDHLRHLKLAQIEVLEEMQSKLYVVADQIAEQIAALRKEIVG